MGQEKVGGAGRATLDLAYTTSERLTNPETPQWMIQGLASARILLDKTGRVRAALETLLTVPEERVRELQAAMLRILRNPEPAAQAALEDRVEALLRGRGYGEVVDAWEGEIERVKRLG